MGALTVAATAIPLVPGAPALAGVGTAGAAYIVVSDSQAHTPAGTAFTPTGHILSAFSQVGVVHGQPGQYAVYLDSPTQLMGQGVAQVRAVGNLHCYESDRQPLYYPSPAFNVIIDVSCEDRLGDPQDSAFQMTFSEGGPQEGVLVSAYIARSLLGCDTCAQVSNQNSSIGGSVTVTGTGPGTFEVDLPRPGNAQVLGTDSIQVSGTRSSETCAVTSTSVVNGGAATAVDVKCLGFWGVAANENGGAVFAISYSAGASVLGMLNGASDAHAQVPLLTSTGVPESVPNRNRIYGGVGLPVTVTRTAPGHYEATLGGQAEGLGGGLALITPAGASAAGGLCSDLGVWTQQGPDSRWDAVVDISCLDFDGSPLDTPFNLQFMTGQ